ncbi:MAG: hypothetical protein ACK5LN_05925 [Propioniciclava sp.]
MTAPSSDPMSRQIKALSSEARKLGGWVGSDPGMNDPLVDTLNELTALRLVQHAWGECFAEAQDALTRATQLVAFHGAVGPFTPLDDATRFFTATTHVAWAQAGAGQEAASAQTLRALTAWREQVPHLELASSLLPRTASWFLLATARARLAAGEVGVANAAADAALLHARHPTVAPDQQPALLVDVLHHQADARWAAGWHEESISAGAAALTSAWQAAEPVLAAQARASKPWAIRVLRPLVILVALQAGRLATTGADDAAATLRADFLSRTRPVAQFLADLPPATMGSIQASQVSPEAVPPPGWIDSSSTRLPGWEPLSAEAALIPVAEASAPPEPEPAPDPVPEPAATPEPGDELVRDQPGPSVSPAMPPTAVDPVDEAESTYRAAVSAGDPAAAARAADHWVAAARTQAAADEATGGPALLSALEALAEATQDATGWWAARPHRREARALAKRLGR